MARYATNGDILVGSGADAKKKKKKEYHVVRALVLASYIQGLESTRYDRTDEGDIV